MQESSWNKYKNWPKHEIFSKTCIPPEISFFIRLDGWKFRKLSETIKAEKPFDKKFAKCLVSSGKILFKKGFNPALIYVASDELNTLFLNAAPFRRRIEKINSVLASLVSNAFSLNLQRFFNEKRAIAFDSRIVVASTEEKMMEYLSWRQINAWRNHNNAYAYWIFREMGYKPVEISKKLKGLKTEELHEIVFGQGVNLAKTPQWQRRGIFIYKHPFLKKTKNHLVTRWKLEENWNLPLFTSREGVKLIQQILE
ncbi:MAG: tRNA 5'-guanylyltransferase [Candidatus Bathyarchaeota archaeon]|nr:tRNA 5'-guanylyltransferase [Candidatus Bathyarchaeota archaeon]